MKMWDNETMKNIYLLYDETQKVHGAYETVQQAETGILKTFCSLWTTKVSGSLFLRKTEVPDDTFKSLTRAHKNTELVWN